MACKYCGNNGDLRVRGLDRDLMGRPLPEWICLDCYVPAELRLAAVRYFEWIRQARAYKRLAGSGDAYEVCLSEARAYSAALRDVAEHDGHHAFDLQLKRQWFRDRRRDAGMEA